MCVCVCVSQRKLWLDFQTSVIKIKFFQLPPQPPASELMTWVREMCMDLNKHVNAGSCLHLIGWNKNTCTNKPYARMSLSTFFFFFFLAIQSIWRHPSRTHTRHGNRLYSSSLWKTALSWIFRYSINAAVTWSQHASRTTMQYSAQLSEIIASILFLCSDTHWHWDQNQLLE